MNIAQRVVASFLLLLAGSASADCLAPAWEIRSRAWSPNNYFPRITLAVAHFDNDAILDAVTIRPGAPSEVILARGTGGGSFAEPVSVYTGTTLRYVVATDMNRDAKTDLVVHEDGNLRMVFLPGNGDGTFGTPVLSPMQIGFSFAVADLTGDGIDDIAASTYEESGAKLTLYTGTSTGAFPETSRRALRTIPIRIAAGDLDGDEKNDLVVVNANEPTFELFFGKGDGTFDEPITKANGARPDTINLIDADGNGELDLLFSSSPDKLTLHRNLGGRSFTGPAEYPIVSSDGGLNGSYAFDAADVTGDGIRDIIATATNGGYIATLRGNGDGTFEAATIDELYIGQFIGPIGAVLDLDGDNRLDVITTSWATSASRITSLLNRCGDAVASVYSHPVVSTGTPVTYQISVRGAPLRDFGPRPAATGTVSLLEGDKLLATTTLVDGAATVTLPAPGVGEHALTVRYSGDAQYEPAQSAAFAQRVTTETTTTAVRTEPSETVYGQEVRVYASVTASNGSTPTGTVDFQLGPNKWERLELSIYGPSTSQLPAGTYTATARYSGNATLPPSEASITHVVHKAPSTIAIVSIQSMNDSGSNVTIHLDNSSGYAMNGTIRLYDGDRLVSTHPRDRSAITMELHGLAPGPHLFRAEYSGDSNFHPSTSATRSHQTLPWSGGRRRSARK